MLNNNHLAFSYGVQPGFKVSSICPSKPIDPTNKHKHWGSLSKAGWKAGSLFKLYFFTHMPRTTLGFSPAKIIKWQKLKDAIVWDLILDLWLVSLPDKNMQRGMDQSTNTYTYVCVFYVCICICIHICSRACNFTLDIKKEQDNSPWTAQSATSYNSLEADCKCILRLKQELPVL